MTSTTLHGSCLCGTVRYTVTGTPTRFMHCHCSRCRKATGTGHASNLFFDPGTLAMTTGADQVRAYKVPEALRFSNSFCTVCGSRVPYQRQNGAATVVVVPAGSLDEEPPIRPQARIFQDSRAAWSCAGDGIATFAQYVQG